MHDNSVLFSIFIIFFGAAVFSTLAVYTKQSLLIAYMFLGMLLGPWGFKLVSDVQFVQKAGDIGIIFLLFLLGIHLHPKNLLQIFGKTFWTTVASAALFLVAGFGVSYAFGYGVSDSLIVGAAMMFSSTIIGLKLLPTTKVYQQRSVNLMVSILLLQDFLAIAILLFIQGAHSGKFSAISFISLLVSLPALLIGAWIFARVVLRRVFSQFRRISEYMFLISIAWCLGVAELAHILGLSYEIGAFIAGIAITANSVSFHMTESLKPLRDFFLVLFFFAVGASFNLHYFSVVVVPAVVMTVLFIALKPFVLQFLLRRFGEDKSIAREVGIRLGQVSEFSLLIAYMADRRGLVRNEAVYLIQAVTMLMFMLSSFIVGICYQTPNSMTGDIPENK